MSRVAVYFVVEGRHLEAQAVVLAASLRRHNGARDRLIAYRPAGAPELLPVTRAALDALDVDTRSFDVPDNMWKKPFPHGNKLLASIQPREEDGHVFLDTDMICARPLDFADVLAPGTVSVVPEGVPSWGKDNDRWERAYAHFDLPLPQERVRLTRRRRIEFYPYFNAGMIAFGSDTGRPTFPELWLVTARDIDWHCRVAKKRPWLDQIALPITFARFDVPYRVLPDTWNFSISDRAFEPDATPTLIHYHSFRYTHAWPQARREMEGLAHTLGNDLARRLYMEFAQFWMARQPA